MPDDLSAVPAPNSVSSQFNALPTSGFTNPTNDGRALRDTTQIMANPLTSLVGDDFRPLHCYNDLAILRAGDAEDLLTGSQAYRGAALGYIPPPSIASIMNRQIRTLDGVASAVRDDGAGDLLVVNEGSLPSHFLGEDWSNSPLFPDLPEGWNFLPTAVDPATTIARSSPFTSTSTKRSHDNWQGPDSETASASSTWTDGFLDLRPPGSSGARKRFKSSEQPRRDSERIALSNQALILGRTADRKELSRSLVNTYLEVVHAQYPVGSVMYRILYVY
jgi:hypothetical protein